MMPVLFLALLAAVPQSAAPAASVEAAAPAATPRPVTPAQAALQAKGVKLAELLNPEAAIVGANDEAMLAARDAFINAKDAPK